MNGSEHLPHLLIRRPRAHVGAKTFLALFILVLAPRMGWAQRPPLEISDIRLGFRQVVEPGFWLPIEIDITTTTATFQGTLELTTPDNDELNTSIIVPHVSLTQNDRLTVHHYVKLGTAMATVIARLRDEAGDLVAERRIGQDQYDVLESATRFILGAGQPSGLASLEKYAQPIEAPESGFVTVRVVSTVDQLPIQWFAYGPVDDFVVSTRSQALFDEINTLRATALQTWVRQGGHLVISVANNWQVVSQSFLGPMLPANITGVARLRTPAALESFAGAAQGRMATGEDGMQVAVLEDVRGTVTVEDEDKPLIVTGNYGLGTVTLLTFDTDMAPFQNWKGQQAFWGKLLNLRIAVSEETNTTPQGIGRLSGHGITDVATLLHNHLEHFPDVKVVPFGWVAALIFGYILLIGPVDYLFLKRVVGRLELTWITFPAWVIVISVAAYFAAHWLKGDQLRINRIELIDIDAESQTLRGSSYVSVFSPRVAKYTLSMTPDLARSGTWNDLGMGREQVDRITSWLGIPESGHRGIRNQGGTGLLGRRGYFYSLNEPTDVHDVPIQVWSVKAFTHRWLAQAAPVVEADLAAGDISLGGTISNLLAHPLEDVVIAYQGQLCEAGTLAAKGEPGAMMDLDAKSWRSLKSFMDEQSVSMEQVQYINDSQIHSIGLRRVVHTLMFAGRRPPRTELLSSYLQDLDLSRQLDLGRAILVARVPSQGGTLWLNCLPQTQPEPDPIVGVTRTDTFIRLIIDPSKDNRS